MFGLAVERDRMGREVTPTAVGIGSAAVAGYAIGNMFTGGYLEEGSIGAGVLAAAVATGFSARNWYQNRRTAGGTSTPRIGKISGAWNTVKSEFNGLSSRNKKVVSGLGAFAGTLAVTETSNALNWPFGGFNNVGAFFSAGVVSAGVVFGGKIKDKVSDWNLYHPVITKVGLAAVGLATLGIGAYAWNKGWIGGHGHGGGKGGASEHADKVPTTSGNGSSTTQQVTSTTAAPSTTGGNGSTSSVVSTTAAPSGNGTSTTVATVPPATPVPGSNGGGSFTLETFTAANKPGMVTKIQELQPGLSTAKANSIADQIMAGQYANVTEHGAEFTKFISGDNQAAADAMFRYDVSVLAVA